MDDVPPLLRMMDLAMEWLVKQGRTGQWGTKKSSDDPRRVEQLAEFARSGGLWVAVDAASTAGTCDDATPSGDAEGSSDRDGCLGKGGTGSVIGALDVGEASSYVKPATEPELYIRLLLTDRAWAGRGVGGLLLEKAKELAYEAHATLLRVDCYAGDDEKLVRHYVALGFERGEKFEERGWSGQVLSLRLGERIQ